MVRVSNVVYILIRVLTAAGPSLLLRRHKKWGDWSLVGGHVEESEINHWSDAAEREATEELEPLVNGRDFVIQPIHNKPITWGPEPSRSAQGQRTIYHVQFYTLTFRRDPAELLSRLPADDFKLVSEHELESVDTSLGKPVHRAREFFHGNLDVVPPAWDKDLDPITLPPNMQPSRQVLRKHG